ncbi:MAG TPA: C40 family peptidase [Nevskiaceae bacterium]|nr:C40 family peptidase [Nevskiaceae bacterium]
MRAPYAALALALLIAGCAPSFKPDHSHDDVREQVVETALAQLGRPYRYGGTDPDSGFDCSGLVWYSYAQAGMKVPRSTRELMSAGTEIRLADAAPGDLLFYRFSDKEPSNLHVVLYVGDGRAVHAPTTTHDVRLAEIGKPEWQRNFVTAVTLLR